MFEIELFMRHTDLKGVDHEPMLKTFDVYKSNKWAICLIVIYLHN